VPVFFVVLFLDNIYPILVTKVASRLQNMLFEYKSGFSFTNISLSVTKMAFRFTKWHLVLPLSSITKKTPSYY